MDVIRRSGVLLLGAMLSSVTVISTADIARAEENAGASAEASDAADFEMPGEAAPDSSSDSAPSLTPENMATQPTLELASYDATASASSSSDSSSSAGSDVAETVSPDGASGNGVSEVSEDAAEEDGSSTPIWANYYGIYNGSSLKDPGSYQPAINGEKNPNRPVEVKNYLTVGYNVSDKIAVAATGALAWHAAGQNKGVSALDPSARVAMNSILSGDHYNWYGDARVYFPVTYDSRRADLLAGVQTFHYVSYDIPQTRLTFGLYGSARYNHYGKVGYGNDLELYLAPAAFYQVSRKFAVTMLYEMGASHTYGADSGQLDNDGTDLQPGFAWEFIPSVTVNPYLTLYTGGKVNASTTAVGVTLSWLIL